MKMTEPKDSTTHEVIVPLSRDKAFALFALRFDSWWPREYTWSQEALDTIGIEPFEGGRCTERGPEGFQADFGRVLVWRPPEKLVFSWQISPARVPQPDPANASTVEIVFKSEGVASSRVILEHHGFSRHGEGASGYREDLASEYGWPFILKRYAEAADI